MRRRIEDNLACNPNHGDAMKRLLSLSILLAMLAGTAANAQQMEPVATNMETRIATLEEQMRALNGQLEQLNFSIRRLDQGVQRMQADYDGRLSRLETSAAALQTAAENARAASAPGTLGAVKTTPDGHAPETAGTAQNAALPQLDNAPESAASPQEQYEKAFGLLRQANYDEAEKAFRVFIDKYPKDKMIDNAKYWYAETFYGRGKFAEATAAFGDAFQQNPKGTKAPDSLLKLAMSLGAINKRIDACTALYELKTKYPSATPSVLTRATEESTKLKCSAT